MQSIWNKTPKDGYLFLITLCHCVAVIYCAYHWVDAPTSMKAVYFFVQVLFTVYNIIVVSHFLSHLPWFTKKPLNAFVSMLNSHNISQSICAYHLTHVRNHHKYNNDRKGQDGKTKDYTSTYSQGEDGNHSGLFQYAFVSAFEQLIKTFFIKDLGSVFTLGKVLKGDSLREFLSLDKRRKKEELMQLRLDRLAIIAGFSFFLFVSWKWVVFCYLPGYYLSLACVNIQNYYEHYGAEPDVAVANSVSYYGKIYNALAFNDGYHQEHHLRCSAHWSDLPAVREKFSKELDSTNRIISKYPAIVGFLDLDRELLHQKQAGQQVS